MVHCIMGNLDSSGALPFCPRLPVCTKTSSGILFLTVAMSWVRFGYPSCTLLGLRTFALVQPRCSGHNRVPGVASVTALDQLVAYNTTFFNRREVVQVPLCTGDSMLRMQVIQLAAD
jgi:hypothetical protein